jgi:hypothetical protein
LSVKAHLEKFPHKEKSPKISMLKVENFQLQNFFPTENLCRPTTFCKNIFLSGNGLLACVAGGF